MISINYTHEINECDYYYIVDLYKSVGWNNHDLEKVMKIMNASTHLILAKDDDLVIGIARAMSDGVFNAAIYDVVVHPNYQRQGIAKQLVQKLLNQFENLSCIHLISTTGNEQFYRKLGFKKLITGMAIYHKSHLEAEYTE